jgi:hypothetical protein
MFIFICTLIDRCEGKSASQEHVHDLGSTNIVELVGNQSLFFSNHISPFLVCFYKHKNPTKCSLHLFFLHEIFSSVELVCCQACLSCRLNKYLHCLEKAYFRFKASTLTLWCCNFYSHSYAGVPTRGNDGASCAIDGKIGGDRKFWGGIKKFCFGVKNKN